MANVFSAGFHLVVQRTCPLFMGSVAPYPILDSDVGRAGWVYPREDGVYGRFRRR